MPASSARISANSQDDGARDDDDDDDVGMLPLGILCLGPAAAGQGSPPVGGCIERALKVAKVVLEVSYAKKKKCSRDRDNVLPPRTTGDGGLGKDNFLPFLAFTRIFRVTQMHAHKHTHSGNPVTDTRMGHEGAISHITEWIFSVPRKILQFPQRLLLDGDDARRGWPNLFNLTDSQTDR